MPRGFVLSLFLHWRTSHPKPQHQSLTDFWAAMGEDNLNLAMTIVTRQRPRL